MVNVVLRDPPTEGKTRHVTGDESSDRVVCCAIACELHVTGVVCEGW